MLDKNWNTSDLMKELETKSGIASLAPTAYAFGLCFAYLTDAQRKQIADAVNKMENK